MMEPLKISGSRLPIGSLELCSIPAQKLARKNHILRHEHLKSSFSPRLFVLIHSRFELKREDQRLQLTCVIATKLDRLEADPLSVRPCSACGVLSPSLLACLFDFTHIANRSYVP